MLVRLIPVGSPPAQVLSAIAEQLPQLMGARVRLLTGLPMPAEAYNHFRRQHNAEKILEMLGRVQVAKFIDKDVPTLFVTDADLYFGGMNFVFGLEDPAASSAIISIARLRPEFYDQRANMAILTERAVKEAVHEIGHHLGLGHCEHRMCVMCFSPSASDVDTKDKDFCKGCKIKLATKGVHISD